MSSLPVTKDESSLARNRQTLATSRGVPILPMGVAAMMPAFISSDWASTNGVRMSPGWTEFTRMFSGA